MLKIRKNTTLFCTLSVKKMGCEWNITQLSKRMSFAATWKNLETVILSEVSRTEKEKYCPIVV